MSNTGTHDVTTTAVERVQISRPQGSNLTRLALVLAYSLLALPANAEQVLKETLSTLPRGDSLEVRLATVTIPPGTVERWHSYPNHPIVYVIEGTLQVEFRDGGSKVYKAGDGFIEPINTILRGSNHGPAPVKLVVFRLSPPASPDAVDAPSQ